MLRTIFSVLLLATTANATTANASTIYHIVNYPEWQEGSDSSGRIVVTDSGELESFTVTATRGNGSRATLSGIGNDPVCVYSGTCHVNDMDDLVVTDDALLLPANSRFNLNIFDNYISFSRGETTGSYRFLEPLDGYFWSTQVPGDALGGDPWIIAHVRRDYTPESRGELEAPSSDIASIPEPATVWLLGCASVLFTPLRRRVG